MKQKSYFIGMIYPNLEMKISVRYDFWKGASDAAEKSGIKLVTFVGGEIQEPTTSDRKGNFIYDLVDTAFFNGLLVWSSGLANQIGIKNFETYCKRFLPLPIVNLEPTPKDKLSSYSYTGMYAGIKHLIEKHNCKKIAYIPAVQGNIEAEFRLLAYKDVLKDHNIPFDPDLVAPYDYWLEDSGTRGIEVLFDKRRKNFDALAAANDDLAIGAMKALDARSIKIPDEVKVIGFNGSPECKYQSPPLTSVEAPFQKLGKIALVKLIHILDKNEEYSQEEVFDKIIIRNSCGCKSDIFLNANIKNRKSNSNFFQSFIELEKIGNDSVMDISKKMFKSLKDSINKKDENIFLNLFQYYLNLYIKKDKKNDVDKWENVISELHKHYFNAYLTKSKLIKAENLFHQARVLLYENNMQYNLKNASIEKNMFNILLEINNKLSTSFNLNDIFNIVLEDFPKLNISGCYISFFEENDLTKSNARLMFAYNKDGKIPINIDGLVFPAKEIIPNEIMDKSKINNQVVMGLFFHREEIGFIVYDADINSMIFFDQLTIQLSTSFRGVFLVQKIQAHSKILEKGIEVISSVIEDMTQNISKITNDIFRQTTTVEESTVSIEEMTRNVEGIIDISNTASEISKNLKSTADEGVNAVKKSVKAIQEVHNKSRDILELLDLIQDISNRTNILAINSSIEAAHAGETGAGFKIVANEIRQFANETKKNIGNISNVVKSLVSKIEESSNFSSDTISGLEKIILHSQKNFEISGQLFNSVHEEKKAIDNILIATQELLQISLEIKSSMVKQTEATENFKKSILKLKDIKYSSTN